MTMCSSDVSFATKPDAYIEIVEQRDFVVDLYLVDLELSDDLKIKGAHFAWLPAQVEEECFNKSYDECQKYYHENYRVEKNAEGRIVGFRKKTFLKKIFKEYPDRVLGEWLTRDTRYDNERLLLDEVAHFRFISELFKNGNKSLNLPIMKDKKIKAKIHWELWPNGQNFKVVKFLK